MANGEFGRSNRRSRREAARAVAKEFLRGKYSADKVTNNDWLLFCLAGALALALFIAEKTPVGVGITLIAIFALLLHPLTHTPWVISSTTVAQRRLRVALSCIGALIAISLFGYYEWPRKSELQNKVERIEKNTEPTAYVKYAGMLLAKGSPPLAAHGQMQFNIWTENAGGESATDFVGDAKIYLGKPHDKSEESRLSQEFEQWWKNPSEHPHFSSKAYPAADRRYLSAVTPILTNDDIKQIRKKKLTFYTFTRLIYSDHNGRWGNDNCAWMQDPFQSLLVAKGCQVNNNPNYKVAGPTPLGGK